MAINRYAGMKFDTKTGKFTMTPLKGYQMKQQVNAEINPMYNAQKTAARNTLQQNKLGLINQQQDVNRQYATGVTNLDDTFKKQAEAASQTALGSGIARSSIAQNMQDEVGQQKAGALADLETTRASTLGDIQNQRNQMQTEYNNAMLSMDTQRAQEILQRLNELKQQQADMWLASQQWNQSVKKR